MIHNMKLHPSPYFQIKSASKTVELRLCDVKRQQIHPGDTIIFSNTEIPDLQLTTQVIALHKFPSFAELFESLPIYICGFNAGTPVEAAVAEMRQYYSAEQEKKYGVLGIEIKLVDEDNDWTKHCGSSSFNAGAFVKRMERIKAGESTLCPFCGGTVRMVANENGHTVIACDTCDMTIELESKRYDEESKEVKNSVYWQ